jgi:hypothetical protein
VGDPRFERTVILIVEQGLDGTVGIVVNKPIGEQPLASVFKALRQKDGDAKGSVRVFLGRPGPTGNRLRSPQSRLPSARDRRDHGSPFDDVKVAIIARINALPPLPPTPEPEPTPEFSVASYARAHGLDGRDLRKRLRAAGLKAPYALADVEKVALSS